MNDIKRVCIINSSPALLQYLLISSIDEIDSTFFFWSDAIPLNIKQYFNNRQYSFDQNQYKSSFSCVKLAIKIYLKKLTIWTFLKKKGISYWGQDHLFFTSPLVGNNKIQLLEDGLANYLKNNNRAPGGLLSPLKKLLYGPIYSKRTGWYGEADYCTTIHLTGLISNSPILKNKKVQNKSFEFLWSSIDSTKRNLILKIFDFSIEDINLLKKYNKILLTQPLDTIPGVSEQDKINYYANEIGGFNVSDIIVKPHPRERTDYKSIFKRTLVFDKIIPFQLFSLCNIHFKDVYTISTSAVFDNSNTNIHLMKCKWLDVPQAIKEYEKS